MTSLYVPWEPSDAWLPTFEADPDGAPAWFITGYPHGGLTMPSPKAGPDDKQCRSRADGLRCDRIAKHLDTYRHQASWDDGAFTLIWGGSI